MAKTIDKYLVEMNFDASKFTSGVNTTLKKVNELKDKLTLGDSKNAFKNLNKDIKDVDFAAMATSLEQISNRFSTMGIIGMTIITRLTNAALDFGNTVIHKVLDPIAEGGKRRAQNIESARFQLLGLTGDVKIVEQYMTDANNAVSGTAYGLDSAAKAAAQLAASGISAGGEMESILRGIAGVAAMTNSSYDDMAKIFTTVAGNGRLMTEQLNQMASRGLNAAAVLADYFGVTEQTLRQMVTNGEVSFDMFYTAMNAKFGEFATKANETYSGSLSNFQAALGRIGALFYQHYMNGARDFFNTMTPVINQIKNSLTPLEQWFKNFLGGTMVQNADGAWVEQRFGIVGAIADQVDKLDFSPLYDKLAGDGTVERLGIVSNIVTVLSNAFSGLWKVLSTVGGAIWDVFSPAKKLGEVFWDVSESVANWSKNLVMSDKSATVLTGIIRGLATIVKFAVDAFFNLAEIVINIVGFFKPLVGILFQVVSIFGEFIYGIGKAFQEAQLFNKVMSALGSVLGPPLTFLRDLVTGLADFVYNLMTGTKEVDEFGNVIEGSLTPAAAVGKVLVGIVLSLVGVFVSMVQAVGDAGQAIKNFLVPYIQALVDWFSKLKISTTDIGTIINTVVTAIKNWFKDLDGNLSNFKSSFDKFVGGIGEGASKVISGLFTGAVSLKDLFVTVLGGLATFFEGVFSKVGEIGSGVFGSIAEISGTAFETAKKNASNFGDAVSVALNPIQKIGEGIKLVFGTIWEFVKIIGSKIGGAIGGLGSGFADFISSIDIGKIIDLVSTGAIAYLAKGFGDVLNAVGNLIDNAAAFTESISGIFDGLTESMEAMQKAVKAKAIKDIATAILMIVAAITVLTFLDPVDVAFAIGTITIVFKELTMVMAHMEQISKKAQATNYAKLVSSLTAISSAMLLLAASIKLLSTISPERLASSLLGMAGILVIFGGIIEYLKTLHGQTINSVAKKITVLAAAMKPLAVALGLMGVAVKIFASMDFDEMIQGLIGVGAVLGGMGVFMKFAEMDQMSPKAGAGLIALALTLSMLAGTVKKFAKMSWDDMIKGFAGLATSLALLIGALKLLPNDLASKTTGIVGLSLALTLLSGVINILGGMDLGKLVQGLAGLIGVMATLVISMNAMKPDAKMVSGLVALSVALNLLVPVIWSLGSMDLSTLAVGLGALGVAMGILVGAGALAASTGAGPAILALSAGVAAFGAAVALAGVGVLAFGVGLGAMAAAGVVAFKVLADGLVVLSKSLPDILYGIGKAVGSFFKGLADSSADIFEGVKVIIVSLVKALGESAIEIAEVLIQVLVEGTRLLAENAGPVVANIMEFLIQVLKEVANRIPELTKYIIDIIVGIFQALIDAFGDMTLEDMVQFALTIGGLAAILAALSAITSLIPGAMVGLAGLAVVVAELGAIIAIFGAIAQIPGVTWLVNEGGNLLGAIGGAIGQFIGGFAGAIIDSIVDTLPNFGTKLSEFMTNLGPFLDGVERLNPETTGAVAELAAAILIITAADILDAIGSFITGGNSMAEFGESLAEFGKGLKDYADEVKDIDGATVKASADAASVLVDLADKLPKSGGVVQWFTGTTMTMSEFGQHLAAFGAALSLYSQTIGSNFNSAAVEASAKAASLLVDLANKLPKTGGVMQFFTGTTMTMSEFGMHLAAFGQALSLYSATIGSNFNVEAVTASAKASGMLVKLANDMPKTGGLMEFFTGSNMTMSEFGMHLVGFGIGLSEFSKEVKDLKIEPMETAVKAGKQLTKLAESLPDTTKGGLKGAIFGDDTDLGDFGDALIDFGEGIAGLYKEVKSVDADTLTACIDAVKSLSKMDLTNIDEGIAEDFSDGLKVLAESNIQGFVKAFVNAEEEANNAVKTYLDKVVTAAKTSNANEGMKDAGFQFAGKFNGGIGEKYDAAVKRGQELANKAISGVKNKNEDMRKAGFDFAGKFNGGVGDKNSAALKRGQELVTNVIKGVQGRHSEMHNAGFTLAGKFNGGVGDKNSAANTRGKELAVAVVKGASGNYSKMRDAGFTFAGKFNGGVGDKYGAATTRGKELANKVVAGANSVNGAGAGQNFVQGYLNGLNSKLWMAANFGSTLGSSTLASLKRALGIHSPSVEAFKAAAFFNQGFINGIVSGIKQVEGVATRLGESALDGIRKSTTGLEDAINSDMEIDITIAPVVDLTNFDESMDYMEDHISALRDMNPGMTRLQAMEIAAAMNKQKADSQTVSVEEQNGKTGDTTIEFNQYNNSPKALTQLEIYRQTRNQLQMVEGVIKNK